MNKDILENHKIYLERVNFYRKFGYDLEKERKFIVDKALPISGNILEIGTGKGHFSIALAKREYSFTSIDISKEEQKIAKLNIEYLGLEKQVNFLIADAYNLNFFNQSFLVILSVNLFHHLTKPRKALDEMIRLLNPKGKIVLSDFTLAGLDIINFCHSKEGKRHDQFKYCLDIGKDYLISKNFVIEEFSTKVQQVIIAKHK